MHKIFFAIKFTHVLRNGIVNIRICNAPHTYTQSIHKSITPLACPHVPTILKHCHVSCLAHSARLQTVYSTSLGRTADKLGNVVLDTNLLIHSAGSTSQHPGDY